MYKPSVTLHIDPAGKVNVVYAGLDAGKAVQEYRDCNLEGDIVTAYKVVPDKRKVIRKSPVAATVAPKATKKTGKD